MNCPSNVTSVTTKNSLSDNKGCFISNMLDGEKQREFSKQAKKAMKLAINVEMENKKH